jgi:chromosome segregation ATPase
MKSRLEKVYNKLPNQKIDLKAQEIKLSIASDLENEEDKLQELIYNHQNTLSTLEDVIQKYKDAEQDMLYMLEQEVNEFEGLLNQSGKVSDIMSELETKVGELGFAPSDLYPGYNQLVNDIDMLENVDNKREFLIKSVR